MRAFVHIGRWFLATFLAVATAPAAAQSLYGCSGLDRARVPVVEGLDGMFFRVDPDLAMDTGLTDGVVAAIARLSDALASRGTKLIFVPLPTRALVVPDLLGPDASAYAYDTGLAAAIHRDSLDRLERAGVNVVDARSALRRAPADELAFFSTDPRLGNHGLWTLARAVAPFIPEGTLTFATAARGWVTVGSSARFDLRLACDGNLPNPVTPAYATHGPHTQADIAVVSTPMTGTPVLNFSGFLSQETARRAQIVSVNEDPLAALLNYVAGAEFQASPPPYLVWEVPVWTNLAARGDQPLAELTAMVRNDCGTAQMIRPGADGVIRADLSQTTQSPGMAISVAAMAPLERVEATFVSDTGQRRTRTVMRDRVTPGRAIIPLSGLWPEGAAHVEITTGGQTAHEVMLCNV